MFKINDFIKVVRIINKNGIFLILTFIGLLLSFMITASSQPTYVYVFNDYAVNILFLLIVVLFNSFVFIVIVNRTRNTLIEKSLITSGELIKKLYIKIFFINLIFSIFISITGLTTLIGIYLIPFFFSMAATHFSVLQPFLWILAFICVVILIFATNSIIITQTSISNALKESIFLHQRISLKQFAVIITPAVLNLVFMFTIPLFAIITTYPSFICTVILTTCTYVDITENIEKSPKEEVSSKEKTSSQKIVITRRLKLESTNPSESIKISHPKIPKSRPFTFPDKITLYRDGIKNDDKSFKAVSVDAENYIESENDRIENINRKLKDEASRLGANAVMNVKYSREIKFGLGKVLEGSGQPVYIENSENIIKTYPNGNMFNILMGSLLIIGGILSTGNIFYCVMGLAGILILFYGLAAMRGYNNKTFYLGYFSLTAIFGYKLYCYMPNTIFQSLYTWDNLLFCILVGFYILIVFAMFFKYKYRKNDLNIPWRGELGL